MLYGKHLVCMVCITFVWYALRLYGRHTFLYVAMATELLARILKNLAIGLP